MTAKTEKTNKFEIRGLGNNQAPHNSNYAFDEKKSGKFSTLSYVFLPGIIPQAKELTRGGFGYLALLIGIIYQAVRILPKNHPYTQYSNLGKFGIRQVIQEAANNIQISKRNIDQIVIFFAIFAGLIIIALQFILFITFMLSSEAWANPSGGLFATANPDTDIAFYMMREVFGIPDMFGTLPSGQTALHLALQGMLKFYNLALLVVAIIIFIYYVIVVVAETAQTGTPFGQRFSHIYAPIRLVIAIGLLVPLNYGYNGAQYITFYAAKMGSGFATTGWSQFNSSLATLNPLGTSNASLIAEVKPPDIDGLVEFMAMATTCREAYSLIGNAEIKSYFLLDSMSAPQEVDIVSSTSTPTQLNNRLGQLRGISNALGADKQEVRIVFGTKLWTSRGASRAPNNYEKGIIPYCGSIIIPQNSTQADYSNFGSVQKMHIDRILAMWGNPDLSRIGNGFAREHANDHSCNLSVDCVPPSSVKESILITERESLKSDTLLRYASARVDYDSTIRQETLERGWGGAGIWYNRIAQLNGDYVVSTMKLPSIQNFPMVMEEVQNQKKASDEKIETCKAYEPNLANGSVVTLTGLDNTYASTLNGAYQYWTCDKKAGSGNFVKDFASGIFGLNGLFSIRDFTEDSSGNRVEIHPLAKLSALGKGLIESSITNMGWAIGSSVVGGISLLGQFATAAQSASSMFVSIATIGLSIGFITYYILPFLPFIYFFFALGNWVKSIFEAMVGAPLWALAHLRIDGDGLPGRSAMNGYLLIFEIFLRPILTVFGLLGGMAIFAAMAEMLNRIFDVVVINTAGVDLQEEEDALFSRHIVDVFFFTCVYAVILYMMAVSSFKMINLVPNNILRWLGNAVAAFSDNAPDPTDGLTQYATIGANKLGGEIAGGLTSAGQAVGGLGDGAVRLAFGLGSKNR